MSDRVSGFEDNTTTIDQEYNYNNISIFKGGLWFFKVKLVKIFACLLNWYNPIRCLNKNLSHIVSPTSF